MRQVEAEPTVEIGSHEAVAVLAGAVAMIGQAVEDRRWVDVDVNAEVLDGRLYRRDSPGSHHVTCHGSSETGERTSFVLKSNNWGDVSFRSAKTGVKDGKRLTTTARLEPGENGSLRRVVTEQSALDDSPRVISDEPTTKDMILAELRGLIETTSAVPGERLDRIQHFQWGHSDGGLLGVRTRAFVHTIGDLLRSTGDLMSASYQREESRNASVKTAFNSAGRIYSYGAGDRKQHIKLSFGDMLAQCSLDYEAHFEFADVNSEGEEFAFLSRAFRRFEDRRGPMTIVRDDLGTRGEDLVWVRRQQVGMGASENVGVLPARSRDLFETELLDAAAALRPGGRWDWLRHRLTPIKKPWPPTAPARTTQQ